MTIKHISSFPLSTASCFASTFCSVRQARVCREESEQRKLKPWLLSVGVVVAMIATTSLSVLSATSAGTATAVFVNTDVKTEGNWIGSYGADGSITTNDYERVPSYAVVTGNGAAPRFTWTSSTTDLRALQKASVPSKRIAAAWLSLSSFSIDLNLTDGNSHQLALYCLDWDGGLAERIDILDATSGVV